MHKLSPQYAAALQRWNNAYAAWDVLAEAGTDYDPATDTWAPESDAEYQALDALLLGPAANAADIISKLDVIQQRAVTEWDDYPKFIERIRADLMELTRPGVSPEMAAAFERWAEVHDRWIRHEGELDETPFLEENTQAFEGVMGLTCATPGDMIVKVYVEAVDNIGSTFYPRDEAERLGGFPFEPDLVQRQAGTDYREDRFQEQMLADLRDCDLGRCMIALGRLTFEPAAWIAAVERAQSSVRLVYQAGGTRDLVLAPAAVKEPHPRHQERYAIADALIAGPDRLERERAVIEYIEASRPDLIVEATAAVEVAA